MRVILTMTVISVMVMVVVVGVMIPRYLKVVKPGQWSRNSLVNVPSIIVAPLLLLVLSLMAMHWNNPSYLRTAQFVNFLESLSYSSTISKKWVLYERIYPNIAMSFQCALRCVMLMMSRGGWRREGVPEPF